MFKEFLIKGKWLLIGIAIISFFSESVFRWLKLKDNFLNIFLVLGLPMIIFSSLFILYIRRRDK